MYIKHKSLSREFLLVCYFLIHLINTEINFIEYLLFENRENLHIRFGLNQHRNTRLNAVNVR